MCGRPKLDWLTSHDGVVIQSQSPRGNATMVARKLDSVLKEERDMRRLDAKKRAGQRGHLRRNIHAEIALMITTPRMIWCQSSVENKLRKYRGYFNWRHDMLSCITSFFTPILVGHHECNLASRCLHAASSELAG